MAGGGAILRTIGDYPDHADEWRVEARMERRYGRDWEEHVYPPKDKDIEEDENECFRPLR